jgi:hypothetical protein
MIRLAVSSLFVALATAPALADLGHLADEGHGHTHWQDFAILGGVAAVAVGWALARYFARRASRRA